MISKRQGLQMKAQRCIHGSYLIRADFSSFLEKDVSFIRRLKTEVRIYIWGKHCILSSLRQHVKQKMVSEALLSHWD